MHLHSSKQPYAWRRLPLHVLASGIGLLLLVKHLFQTERPR